MHNEIQCINCLNFKIKLHETHVETDKSRILFLCYILKEIW